MPILQEIKTCQCASKMSWAQGTLPAAPSGEVGLWVPVTSPTGLLLLGDFGPEVCEIPTYLLSCPPPPRGQTAPHVSDTVPAHPSPASSGVTEGAGWGHGKHQAFGIKRVNVRPGFVAYK